MQITSITESEQNVHHIQFDNGRELFLVGTAHVSQSSVALVERIITDIKPDTIAIELDKRRLASMTQKDSYADMDIVEIIKKKQLMFVIGQFILASFQKKIAYETNSQPGDEFRKAVSLATQLNARLVLADRDIETTLKRTWSATRFTDKFKLIASLLFSKEDAVDPENIEKMKQTNATDEMIKMFAEQLPATKTALIDERDAFLTYEILNNSGDKTVAVVGAGHVPGMLKRFQIAVTKEEREEINIIPPKTLTGKLVPWIIPFVLVAVFAVGFLVGNRDMAMHVAIYWVLANGILAALGCIIALAHPLTILTGFIAAPITSLNPTIGAGFVTALVQTLMEKPRVRDFEQLRTGTMKIRHWWKNRLTKVFLVFLFSSIGSSIGTFIAAPYLLKFFEG